MDPLWDVTAPPAAAGKVIVVTGGNAGIGYFVSEQLAAAGATVVIAGRDPARIAAAQNAIQARVPDATLHRVRVDLASLDSVAAAAAQLQDRDRLDGLVLNAGMLTQRRRQQTADGFEAVFGVNHLGHAALVSRVLPALSPGARVVTVGSYGARYVRLDLCDLQSTRSRYVGVRTYLRSKLAQMVWAAELDRRLRAAGSPVLSVLAHPGGALDGLTAPRPPVLNHTTGSRVLGLAGLALAAQSKEAAAWPLVRAMLDPTVRGGELFGPRFLRSRGRPVREEPPAALADPDLGQRLGAHTGALLGVR